MQMRKYLLLAAAVFGVVACGGSDAERAVETTERTDSAVEIPGEEMSSQEPAEVVEPAVETSDGQVFDDSGATAALSTTVPPLGIWKGYELPVDDAGRQVRLLVNYGTWTQGGSSFPPAVTLICAEGGLNEAAILVDGPNDVQTEDELSVPTEFIFEDEHHTESTTFALLLEVSSDQSHVIFPGELLGGLADLIPRSRWLTVTLTDAYGNLIGTATFDLGDSQRPLAEANCLQ